MGVELAKNEVNNRDVSGDFDIDLSFYDSQARPQHAVMALSELSAQHKPIAVVGGLLSSSTLAMASLAEEQRIVLVSPTASASAVSSAGRFIFRVYPSDALEATAAATWVEMRGLNSVVIVHSRDEYGESLAQAFKQRLSHTEIVVSALAVEASQGILEPDIDLINKSSPDGIFLVTSPEHASTIIRILRDSRREIRLFGTSLLDPTETSSSIGQETEGLIYFKSERFDSSSPTVSQEYFIERFRKTYGVAPGLAAAYSYDAMRVLLEAIDTGARSGDEVRDVLTNTFALQGITGAIAFDENGDITRTVVIREIRNGKPVEIGRLPG